jgi:hypothetical protein
MRVSENKQVKDWTGDTNSVFKGLGASSHSSEDRQKEDFYATEPKATKVLLEVERFNNNIWECACGQGHISEVLIEHGYTVRSSDLINRGYGEQKDFLFFNNETWDGDIITNPPFAKAKEFIEKALEVIPEGNRVAMFLRVLFLEGKERKTLFRDNPPETVYISSSRLLCAKNGNFEKAREDGGAVAYAWFIWRKGFKGNTLIKWIN